MKKHAFSLCILELLARGRRYGGELIRELRQISNGYFEISEGTLYPALLRMTERGYLEANWITSKGKPPRKFYSLTDRGREAHQNSVTEWVELRSNLDLILD